MTDHDHHNEPVDLTPGAEARPESCEPVELVDDPEAPVHRDVGRTRSYPSRHERDQAVTDERVHEAMAYLGRLFETAMPAGFHYAVVVTSPSGGVSSTWGRGHEHLAEAARHLLDIDREKRNG